MLNIYNWSDYIADDTIRTSSADGHQVNYDNYDTNEILHSKLVAGKTGYDIVVPGAHFAKQQIEGGLLQEARPLAADELGQPRSRHPGADGQVDPGSQYLVDWLWGYVTVGINVDKVKGARRPADAANPGRCCSTRSTPRASNRAA